MINNEEKTGNFLKAIQKYADEQKHQIESEVEMFKKEELEKAKEEGLKDAYNLIQKEQSSRRSKIISNTAKVESESKKALYQKRIEITENVFNKAFKKLSDYSLTNEYIENMKKTAKEIAQTLQGQNCIIKIKPKDEGLKGDLSACFNGCNVTVEIEKLILIGGFEVFCQDKGVFIDKTLDTLLNDQKEWFYENSKLTLN